MKCVSEKTEKRRRDGLCGSRLIELLLAEEINAVRIWDLHPGYLNRQSLLGEHRELHGLVNVLTQNKKGYSRHPETLRWVGFGWALKQRHALLAAEMALSKLPG